jgi:hypothetical protein
MGISTTTMTLFTTPDNPSSCAVTTMTAQVSSSENTVAGDTMTFVDTYNDVTRNSGYGPSSIHDGNAGTAILEVASAGMTIHIFGGVRAPKKN